MLCVGYTQNTLDLSTSAGLSNQLFDSSSPFGSLRSGDQSAFAYRIGASYSAKIAYRTYMCVGGNYTSLATKSSFDPTDLRWGSQWNGTAFDPSIASGEDFAKTTNVSRESQFEIPVTVRRYIGNTEKFYVLSGIVPALHIRYVNVVKQDGGERIVVENSNSNFQNFQLATRIGLGSDWTITEKIKFYSQINGQVHLLEDVENSGLRWWDVSLHAGIRLGI